VCYCSFLLKRGFWDYPGASSSVSSFFPLLTWEFLHERHSRKQIRSYVDWAFFLVVTFSLSISPFSNINCVVKLFSYVRYQTQVAGIQTHMSTTARSFCHWELDVEHWELEKSLDKLNLYMNNDSIVLQRCIFKAYYLLGWHSLHTISCWRLCLEAQSSPEGLNII